MKNHRVSLLAFSVLSIGAATSAQTPPPPPIQPPDIERPRPGDGGAVARPATPPRLPSERTYAVVNAFPGQKKFDRPLQMEHHPTDPSAFYVVEQYGKILRISREAGSGDRVVFLDWSEQCLDPRDPGGNNEEGLLGFAFDPDYAKTRHVYIYYSRKTGERKSRRTGKAFPLRESVVSRLTTKFQEDGHPVADPKSELVLLRVKQPFGNHNGGTIVFGLDKMLYIALGDGGYRDDPYEHGQNLKTLLGSILRIDVREATAAKPYAVPKDNPFVGVADARPEIWAYGLRNPWRIAFDRETGALWCGDVGQEKWEEVDRIVKGGNYGWNKREGMHSFTPRQPPAALVRQKPAADPKASMVAEVFQEPIAEYSHQLGVSITGGHVYRGSRLPELRGRYLYADYVSGRLWCVREDPKGKNHQVTLLVRNAGAVASFAEGPDGEAYVLRYDGDVIHRLVRQPKRTK